MFTSPLDPYVLLALIALLPGAISWWSGRRLARLADDPAFPELFAAHRRRNRAMMFIAMVALGLVTSLTLSAVALPLTFSGLLVFAGLIAAAYPLRRALYHETWSFGSYFCFYPRVIAGLFGFWIVLAFLPNLAALAGTWDWLVGAALGGLLVLWNIYYADVVRSCLRTRPLPEGEFLARCRALAGTCGVPQPRFERIDLEGGVIANALALPSLRTPSVLFTDTMLERFDEKELLGICAHELAHFEHFNPGFLRRLNYVTYGVIAVGVAFAPVVRITGLDSGPLPGLLWFAALLTSVVMRARDKQRQETICDLRAVELTGDPDGLIRGLTKLHTLARMPRRLEQQTERSATHPSLARRIRDIRKAGGVAPAVLGGAERFTSADGRTSVIFDVAELHWAQPDAVTHSVCYSGLTELRVDARPSRGSRLIALGANARRWEMPLADSDVARLQAVLDVVDDRLGDPPQPLSIHPRVQRAAVLMAASTVLALSQPAVAFVALLAWVRPSLPLLVGAGLAALTAAGLVLRDHGSTAYLVGVVLPLAGIGLVLLGLAWGHRHDDRGRMRTFIALLAIPAAIGCAALAMGGVDVVRLHQSARTLPSATVLLVALAGALACSKARRVRLSAAAVGAGALAITVVASTSFLERFATDPFLVDAPALDWVSVGSDAIAEFDVPSGTSRINLSPNGQYVAVYQEIDSVEDHASTFQIGRVGQALTSISAEDVAFVDDDQVLVLLSDSHGTTLKILRPGSPHDVVWEQFLEDVSAPSLSFDHRSGRWRVMGWDSDRSIVRVEGRIGSSDVLKKRWPAVYTRASLIDALTTVGPEVLVVETQYDRGLLARMIPWRWTWAHVLVHPYYQVSRYAMVSDNGRRPVGESKLDVDCMADVLDGGLACSVYDGTSTHLVRIDAGTGHVDGIGVLDGRFVSDRNVSPGWLSGWFGSRPVAISLSTGEVLHLSDRAGAALVLSVASDRLYAVMFGEDHFTVRVHPLPSNMRTPDVVRVQR